MPDIRSIFSNICSQCLPFESAHFSWQLKKGQRFIQCNVLNKLFFPHACEFSLLTFANLDNWSIFTQAGQHFFACFRMYTKFPYFPHRRSFQIFSSFYFGMKTLIEFVNHFIPFFFTPGNVVKFFFHLRSEGIVGYVRKVFYQEIIYNHSCICWK